MKFYFEVGEKKFEIQAPDANSAMEHMNRNQIMNEKFGTGSWAWFDGVKKNTFWCGFYGVWD